MTVIELGQLIVRLALSIILYLTFAFHREMITIAKQRTISNDSSIFETMAPVRAFIDKALIVFSLLIVPVVDDCRIFY